MEKGTIELWTGSGVIVRNEVDACIWPGGYTILWHPKGEESTVDLCPSCAEKLVKRGESVIGEQYDEGQTLHCDDCGTNIESSYGDPEQNN